MSFAPLVHVVDDDLEMRQSLHMLLRSVALDGKTYASADEFLARYQDLPERPSVVLLDVRMPGMSGMTLLQRLSAEHAMLPVIMITGHGDIDMAVRAMKLGARDFITKPFSAQTLLDRIQEVLSQSARQADAQSRAEDAATRLQGLTRRERDVFERIAAGLSNKVVAHELGLSVRTVETHRARIMAKLGARSLVDLVMLSLGGRDDPA
ncbi:MAG: response regulator transcription factor [Bdellovibrio bacteriovorus]